MSKTKRTKFGQKLIKAVKEAVLIAEGKLEPTAVYHFDFSPEGFRLGDIEIGDTFRSAGGKFRCTDKGTRTIAAIRVDHVMVTSSDGEKCLLLGNKAEREGWFNGPPYAVEEIVFDEFDLEGCDLLPPRLAPLPIDRSVCSTASFTSFASRSILLSATIWRNTSNSSAMRFKHRIRINAETLQKIAATIEKKADN